MTRRARLAVALGLAAALALGAGCGARDARTDEPAGAAAAGPQEARMLTDEQAIAIAREEVSDLTFSRWAAPPVVEREGDTCTVTFPIVPPPDEPPMLGPDYDARVELDCRTGRILNVFLGS